MDSEVKIIHTESEEILFSCSLAEVDQAYKRFAEYEEMGLEVKLIVPTTAETLVNQLDVSEEDKKRFRESLSEEIDSHDDDSCCYKPAGFETKKIH